MRSELAEPENEQEKEQDGKAQTPIRRPQNRPDCV